MGGNEAHSLEKSETQVWESLLLNGRTTERRCALGSQDSEKARSPDDITNRIGLCGNCNSRKGVKAWGKFWDEEHAKMPHLRLAYG